MKKTLVRIICFLLILISALYGTNRIFKVKYGDGIYDMTTFYQLEDNTVDVLILGSSHAFENINTGTLWEEYGMASYILAGSIQPMWNTYYYLQEALKTQTPELIVLEGFCTTFDQEFIDDSRIIKNTYGMKWSPDKLAAMKISAPKERWREFIPEYIQYHTRYTELSKLDFYGEKANPLYCDWKGFGCNMATTPLEAKDVSGVTARTPLYEKTETYYRKTLELAKERHIPVMVLISPYAGISDAHKALYNTAADIAAEYDIDFWDGNCHLQEIGIDYATDAADTSHLNYRGSRKFALFLGKYLKDHYEISDRRDDPEFLSWQRNCDYITQQICNQKLREQQDANTIIAGLSNPNYLLLISLDGNCTAGDERLQSFYTSLGIVGDPAYGGVWCRDNAAAGTENFLWYAQLGTAEKYWDETAHDLCLKRIPDAGVYTNHIIVDNTEYKKVQNGVNVVVYDRVTESVADSFAIDMFNDYTIVR